MKTIKRIGWQAAKLSGTGAVVAGVALAIITLSPGEDPSEGVGVSKSEADITWFSATGPTHTRRFADALERLGHSRPRLYTHNGNDVYVSDRTTRKSPTQVMRRYQHQFVTEGVNSRAYLKGTDQLRAGEMTKQKAALLEEMSRAVMNGDIVPRKVSDEKVTMFGLLRDPDEQIDNPGEASEKVARAAEQLEGPVERIPAVYERCGGDPALLEAVQRETDTASADGKSCNGPGGFCSDELRQLRRRKRTLKAFSRAIVQQPDLEDCPALNRWMKDQYRRQGDQFADKVDAFRSIEANRDEESGLTHVTAVWSKRGMNMKTAMSGREGEERAQPMSGPDFPLCHSCESGWSFAGSGSEKSYANHVVWSDRSVPEVATEYARLMAQRGWSRRGTSVERARVRRALNVPDSSTQFLRFTRGKRHLTLRIRPNDRANRTEITAIRSD